MESSPNKSQTHIHKKLNVTFRQLAALMHCSSFLEEETRSLNVVCNMNMIFRLFSDLSFVLLDSVLLQNVFVQVTCQ